MPQRISFLADYVSNARLPLPGCEAEAAAILYDHPSNRPAGLEICETRCDENIWCVCTRPRGHEGSHIAGASYARMILARWPNPEAARTPGRIRARRSAIRSLPDSLRTVSVRGVSDELDEFPF